VISWATLILLGALVGIPIIVRGLRSQWGSPELRATLHAVAVSVALDLVPLLILMLARGKRSPAKK